MKKGTTKKKIKKDLKKCNISVNQTYNIVRREKKGNDNMRRERRLNTMKVVKINKFEEIENSTKTYMTPTNIRIIVEKVSEEDYTLKFDIKTLHMIVDVDVNDRKCRLEIDDMECPYLTIKTSDLSKEIEIMLKQSHVKHGLE